MKREFIKVGKRWHVPNTTGETTICGFTDSLEWTGRITAVQFIDYIPSPMCKGCKNAVVNGYPRERMRMYTNH